MGMRYLSLKRLKIEINQLLDRGRHLLLARSRCLSGFPQTLPSFPYSKLTFDILSVKNTLLLIVSAFPIMYSDRNTPSPNNQAIPL